MNILVTGANGQLGNEIRSVSNCLKNNYIFTDVNQVERQQTIYLDITDLNAVRKMVSDKKINVVINCAAWTDVNACEIDEKLATLAEKLNGEAPKNLALAMKEVNGLLVHISTDYVFGREPYNTPCNPEQKGTPTGVYGMTKLHGEENIIATGCKYIIIRTAWLYSEFGDNFCKTILNLIATKPQLKVVFDQCGTPTYAWDLATAICNIIDNNRYEGNTGIYHYSNEGVTSWYDFAKMIQMIALEVNYYGHIQKKEIINMDCDIQPCYSSEFKSLVIRPSYSVLDKTLFKNTFGLSIPYWVDSLKKCISNLMK